jgi:hypothetical protein
VHFIFICLGRTAPHLRIFAGVGGPWRNGGNMEGGDILCVRSQTEKLENGKGEIVPALN